MDRDRDRDRRPLDIPPEDQYGTGRGQSYRPGGARERTPPPRSDSYRARSPPRRNDFAGGDSYRGGRPRSRTPPRRGVEYRRPSPSPRFRDRDARGGGDSYRARARSPPPARREDLPRDDLFREEPTRDTRDYRDERSFNDDRDYREDRDRSYNTARSPPPRQRERSPLPLKRGREPSPYDSRDRRSPLPAKRERLDSPPRGRYDDHPSSRAQSPPRRRPSPQPRERRQSPPRDYRARSRSPALRQDRAVARDADDWRRPRSPSPQRQGRQQDFYAAEENGERSVDTSRRSSPPLYPSRIQQVDDRSNRQTPRDPYESREPYRARSPEPRRAASPPPREREYADEQDYFTDDRIPPPREPYRADDEPPARAPPTGPAGYRAPPSGPSATPVSISAHARAPAAPPSGPRAAAGPSRGDFSAPRGRGGYRGDFGGRGGFGSPAFRGGRGGAPSTPGYGRGGYNGMGRSEGYDRESDFNGAPPSGPRGSFSQGAPVPFRQGSNMTATTYPRTQRFGPNGQPVPDESPRSGTPTGPRLARRTTESALDTSYSNHAPANKGPHPAIADLPTPIPGGQKAEPLIDRTKLDILENEAEKLRRIIDEKEAKKRKAVMEWDRMSRETEAAAVRSQIAEEALRKSSADADYLGEGASAAF